MLVRFACMLKSIYTERKQMRKQHRFQIACWKILCTIYTDWRERSKSKEIFVFVYAFAQRKWTLTVPFKLSDTGA